jgi:thermitase
MKILVQSIFCLILPLFALSFQTQAAEQCVAPALVAVVDTGIDADHVDLASHLWHDPKQKSTFGWDAIRNLPNPSDFHGHGTHVSGIIVNQSQGCAQIMAIRYYSELDPGSINLKHSIVALNYAIDHGAKIINYSGGGPIFEEDEYLALKKAEAKGILVIAAAGNDHADIDRPDFHYYPASYNLSNIITVASVDANNHWVASSSWGKKQVTTAAWGDGVNSSFPGPNLDDLNSAHNIHRVMSGTSQATAFVSGVAALILGKNPNLTPKNIKRLIVRSTLLLPELKNKVASGGIIDLDKALKLIPKYKPQMATRFISSEPTEY